MKLINLIGQKFNRLIVIKREYPNEKNGNARWLCKCDCGNEKIIKGENLRTGNTKSCGCLRKGSVGGANRLDLGFGNMRALIRDYKRSAKQRGLEWNLTEEQFKELTQKDCFYCGVKPNNISNHKGGYNGSYIYNGIDRINNDLGYIICNIVSCCKECNKRKGISTLQEFLNWGKRFYNKSLKE